MKWYRAAAEQGDATAQFNLALCYEKGIGVEQDAADAVKWYRAAAEQGDAAAQNNLGLCYEKGIGVEQDAADAVKWYRAAAEQGDAEAQAKLGCCYRNGIGVKQDAEQAVQWYRAAAEQGNARAQNNLGACYAKGIGVAQAAAEAVQDAYTPDNKPYVVGSYTGDGTTNNRAINLGFKPRFLIITGMSRSSNEDDSPLKRFALVGPGVSSAIASLTETGFTVINNGSRYPDLNSNWSTDGYIAFR